MQPQEPGGADGIFRGAMVQTWRFAWFCLPSVPCNFSYLSLFFPYFLLHFLVFFLIFSYLGPMGPHGGALGPRIFSREPRPLARFFNPFWADLDSKFGFSVKNRSYSWAQTIISSFFDIRLFKKSGFWLFSLLMGILRPGSIKIERSMQKYFQGLILRFFGLMGGPLVPGEGP